MEYQIPLLNSDFANHNQENKPIEKTKLNVQNEIKAIISSHKEGLPMDSLKEAYYKQTASYIPYKDLGYQSLLHLMREIPDVKKCRNTFGEPVYEVTSHKTKYLRSMIKKQIDRKTYSRKFNRTQFNNQQKDNRRQLYDLCRNNTTKEIEAPVDEKWGRPLIVDDYLFENDSEIICIEPVLGSSQLIGDDYFLQIAIKYLDDTLLRKDPKSPITCGTVQSGLTIKKASKRLDRFKVLSNRLIINVGTVDIYQRRQLCDMMNDYKELLNKLEETFLYSSNQITICTLPPMANVGMYGDIEKYVKFVSFNSWLREFAKSNGYRLLDLHDEFTNDKMALNYEYFQQDARNVSGSIHPHVLWNYRGRQKVVKLILNLK